MMDRGTVSPIVMAGLDPAIHGIPCVTSLLKGLTCPNHNISP